MRKAASPAAIRFGAPVYPCVVYEEGKPLWMTRPLKRGYDTMVVLGGTTACVHRTQHVEYATRAWGGMEKSVD